MGEVARLRDGASDPGDQGGPHRGERDALPEPDGLEAADRIVRILIAPIIGTWDSGRR